MRLLIATNNRGKVREYRDILGDLPLELVFPADIGIDLEVEETGATYEENARLKAQSFAQASGLVTLADDSGLEVDALGGEPGVHSHRYARGSDADRYRVLLEQLQGVSHEERTARFRCVIVIVTPAGETHTCEGICPGVILYTPRGDGGFGYDPIFYLPERGQTMAELAPEEKNRLSHRGRAGQCARPVLEELVRKDLP
jgi:XTP/dITP diphosphohydrolase